jgi:formate dehydrogenase
MAKVGGALGSGTMLVMDESVCAVDFARSVAVFFAHESCGQCTPCRNGTAKASALIEEPKWNVPLLEDLSAVMRDASICGLGQAAPNPVDCVVKYFPGELA